MSTSKGDGIESVQQTIASIGGDRGPLAQDARGALRVATASQSRKLIAQVLLQSTDTSIFTASQRYRDCEIRFVNVSGSSTTYQWHHRKAGVPASDVNAQIKGGTLTVDAPGSWSGFELANGETLSGRCGSNDAVAASLFGIFV